LADLITNYNNSYHRTIKRAPVQVNSENENEILNNTFRINKKETKFKFKVGDKVRISKVKRTFEKGYTPNWTEEIFTISKRFPRQPPVYTIKDQMGEVLQGVFYESELQKIDMDDEPPFIIEKIIKTRQNKGKTDYLVRWRGYPPKFDSWISNLINV